MNRRENDRIKPVKQQQFTLRILDLTFDVATENISPGGIFLTAGVMFPVSAMLEIELAYADTSAACVARIQHRHGYGVGLKFINPSARFSELVTMATERVSSAPEPMAEKPFPQG